MVALDFQYDELMLERSKAMNLKADGVTYGYGFTIRYPSYRGTFLSCIEALDVSVDGAAVSQEDVYFVLQGKQYIVSEFAELCHEYWYVLDDAQVCIRKHGGLAPGDHRIDVRMVHRIPYTGYFGQYLTLESTGTATCRVQ